MADSLTAPTYTLRGLKLIGWRNMQHALDYLYADGNMKQGTPQRTLRCAQTPPLRRSPIAPAPPGHLVSP